MTEIDTRYRDMGGRRKTRVAHLRAAILDYVRVHRDASDTPRGIRRWWLPKDMQDGAAELMDEVLNELTRTGALRCIRLPDGALLYTAGPRLDGADANGGTG